MSLAERVEPFACGGLSAMFASTVVAPMGTLLALPPMAAAAAAARRPLTLTHAPTHTTDRVKTTQQISTTKLGGPIATARLIVDTEGVRGLYRGLSAALVRQATYGTARIGLHRVLSDALVRWNDNKPIPFAGKAAAGMASGALAVVVGSPLDIVLVRMQADGQLPPAERRNYSGVVNALVRIAKEDGVTKLWRGLAPNILRGMAMNAGMLATYDEAKEKVARYWTGSVDKTSTQVMSSAIAGFVCAAMSNPFDRLKSLLMSMRVDPVTGKAPYTGIVHCAASVLRNEGMAGFFRGFPAYFTRTFPHATVILLVNEHVTRAYRKVFGIDSRRAADLVTASRFHSAGAVPNVIHSGDRDEGDDESGIELDDEENPDDRR